MGNLTAFRAGIMDDTEVLGPVNGLRQDFDRRPDQTSLRLDPCVRRYFLLPDRIYRHMGRHCAVGQYLPMHTGAILLR